VRDRYLIWRTRDEVCFGGRRKGGNLKKARNKSQGTENAAEQETDVLTHSEKEGILSGWGRGGGSGGALSFVGGKNSRTFRAGRPGWSRLLSCRYGVLRRRLWRSLTRCFQGKQSRNIKQTTEKKGRECVLLCKNVKGLKKTSFQALQTPKDCKGDLRPQNWQEGRKILRRKEEISFEKRPIKG